MFLEKRGREDYYLNKMHNKFSIDKIKIYKPTLMITNAASKWNEIANSITKLATHTINLLRGTRRLKKPTSDRQTIPRIGHMADKTIESRYGFCKDRATLQLRL